MMINNFYFLTASLLAAGFSVGHAIWGYRYVLGDVQASDMPEPTKHMLWVIWHQPTVFHLCAAVALLIAATLSHKATADAITLLVGVVTCGFLLNYVLTSLIRDRSALAQIIPQAIALAIYFGILAAGILV